AVTGSAWAGLGAAIAASVVVSLVHGFACVTHGGNQVVSGMALNITLSGLTAVLAAALFDQGGQTPMVRGGAPFAPVALTGRAAPGLGPPGRRERSQRPRVSRACRRPARRVDRVPHALRPAPARGRREPGRGGNRGNLGRGDPLSRAGDERDPVRCVRCVSV